MRIKVLGSGEAFDAAGNGNTAFVLYGRGIPTVLFDCGYQVPERLWSYPKLYKDLDAIYFTHTHADHLLGIVPLLARYQEEGRTKALSVFGSTGIKDHVYRLLKLGYPGTSKKLRFKVLFKGLKSGQCFSFRHLKFSCARSDHSQLNLCVRVQDPHGKSFAISGDGNLTPASKKLYAGVDLLLHEAFWLNQEGKGHCSLETVREYAVSHDVKRVGLTHMSRLMRDRIEKNVEKIRKRDKRFFVAEAGQVIQL